LVSITYVYHDARFRDHWLWKLAIINAVGMQSCSFKLEVVDFSETSVSTKLHDVILKKTVLLDYTAIIYDPLWSVHNTVYSISDIFFAPLIKWLLSLYDQIILCVAVLVGAGDIAPGSIWILNFSTDHNSMDTVLASSLNGEICDIF